MTEILIVIAIIVLLLGIAVPAFNLIRGSRSIDSAQNQVSAMLGRARADAIGLQQPHGIMFFIEPNSDRVNIALVYAADFPQTGGPTRDVYLDMVADTDFVALPPGVLALTLNNGTFTGTTRTSDGYLGYNTQAGGQTAGTQFGGVILFGGNGQLISRTYGFLTLNAANAPTRIATVLNLPPPAAPGFVEVGVAAAPPSSSLGVALVDRAAFMSNGGLVDLQFTGGSYPGSTEEAEETWVDNNSTPLLINRYNGTMIESH